MKKLFLVFSAFCFLFYESSLFAQVVIITKPVYTYIQNFDSLAGSGTSSKLPYGWYMYENGSAANTTYTADSGASSTGDTYSYGHKGSTDRALGCLSDPNLQTYIGAQFMNQTGYAINSITVSYTVEQWRLGATGRQDSLSAAATIYASNLILGFWLPLPLLSIHSPVTSGSTGQLDGNALANRKTFTYKIAGIAVNNGSSIWIRWQDNNITGANDGLAIDDFSLSVKAYIPHTIRSSKFPQTAGIPDTTQQAFWKGIVLGQNFKPGGLYFQFKDSTGNITAISASKTFGYTPVIGDSVAVYGTIKSANYLTYIAVDSVGYIGSNFNSGKPKVITNINNDTLESGLVTINHMNLVPGYKWDTTGAFKNSGFMTTMTNGTNTYNVWISNTSSLYYGLPPKFPFNLMGIVLQNGVSPLTGYFIWPRTNTDIDPIPLPTYKIVQVRPQDGISGIADSANTGHLIYLKGIAQSQSLITGGLKFSMEDNTGSIMVLSAVNNFLPDRGDSILVRGIVSQDFGLTELIADSIMLLNKAIYGTPQPVTITSLNESLESQIVKFKNAYIVDSTKWVPAGTDFTVKYTNGTDTIDVRIFDNTDLFQMKHAPKGNYDITGIAGQLKSSLPFIGGYQLYPRSFGDYNKILPFKPLPLYKIANLKGYNTATGIADSLNKGKGYLKGVVYSKSFSATALNFSIVDNTGAITIISDSIKYYSPKMGDSILVHGYVYQNKGVTEYIADTIITITTGTVLLPPQLVNKITESTESDLVKLKDVYLAKPTEWKAAGAGFIVHITNGKDTFQMFVSKTVDLYNMPSLIGHFNITGIGSQNDSTSPYLSNYIIEPRGLFDIQHVLQLYKIRQVRVQNALSGVADSAGSKSAFYLKGIVQSPNFVTKGFDFSIKDSTGSIFIMAAAVVNGYTPVNGDSIFIRGVLVQSNGLTEVVADSVSKLKNGSPVLNQFVITSLNENTEANLIKFNNAWLVDPSMWVAGGTGFNVKITDGQDTLSVYVSSAIGLFNSSVPKGKFNITGIGSQSISTAPYLGGYFMMPRSISDINYLPVPLYVIRTIKPYDVTTGVADSMNTYCILKGTVTTPNLSGNGTQFFGFQDTTGAITVTYPITIKGYSPAAGDNLIVRGTVGQVNGLTVFAMDSFSKTSTSTVKAIPLGNSIVETDESHLVKVRFCGFTDTTQWDTTGSNGKFMVDAHSDFGTGFNFKMEIVRGTNLFNNLSRVTYHPFDVTGLVSQNDPASPYFDNYFIIPRSISDFQQSSGIPGELNSNSRVSMYPNPVNDNLIITASQKMDQIDIVDMVGKTLQSHNMGTETCKLNLSSLQSGVYLVKVKCGEDVIYRKIIKD